MYDTRLEMASSWVWDQRRRHRKPGEPVADPFCQQPKDVTEPVEFEVQKVISAVEVYDSVREINRLDTKALPEVAMDLYKSLNPDWIQTMTEERLTSLEQMLRISLTKAYVTGDVDYDR